MPKTSEREIFLDALEQPEEVRCAFLDRVCGGNTELRSAVEELLKNHKADTFLETPAIEGARGVGEGEVGGTTVLLPVRERVGERIGRYKLLQEIGEGGVGVVFMAEQESPVRRRVALKVIKPGMDSKSVIARFETERQALAMMDHPNIAKVLDAGTTEGGRPYFVMELVRGVRVTEYCDQNNLGTRERLLLFVKVCQAIQHAHQKGIIHRDIKPSNILVTLHDGVPVPKVIDFGIAKAVDQRLTDKTFFTEFQAFIGTPAYMSPEQAEMSGLDIDTRTDVYSLGVLLYEMLTGKTPFDAKELLSSGLDGMRRTIREREPMPPSTRLRTMLDAERTTTAQRQQSEPAKLANVFRGDLDWIVLKALEKDRTRRYETAIGLAMDVQRYLDNEPVLARPPSAVYRFEKWARRNRLAFAAASAFGVALVIGLALSTWQYLEKSEAYKRIWAAEREQHRLRSEAEEERRLAESQGRAAIRRAYGADVNLVQQALAANNLGRAQRVLDSYADSVKSVGMDLRGWEWRYLWQQCLSDAQFTLCQKTNEIHALAVSQDGKWVAVGESDRGLSVWDLLGREEIAVLPAGRGRGAVAFSPVGPLLAFSSADGSFTNRQSRVRFWNVVERRYMMDLPVRGFCRALFFSSDGAKLMVSTSEEPLSIWSVTEEKKLWSLAIPLKVRFEGPVRVSRDLKLAAFGLDEGKLAVIDLERGEARWTVTAAEENVTALAFSPDGKLLASGAGFVESAIRLWNVDSGVLVARLEGHRTWVSSLVFWPDGQYLASGSGDQTVHLWEMGRLWSIQPPPEGSRWHPRPPPGEGPPWDVLMRWGGKGRRMPPRPEAQVIRPSATLRGHKLEVWSLALLPDNSTLVSGSKDGSVYVWATTVQARSRSELALPETVRAWRFSSESRSVIAVDPQNRIVRWTGPEFQEKETIMELGKDVLRPFFSRDGRFMAAGSTNGTTGVVQVWDVQQKRMIREWPLAGGRAMPFSFWPVAFVGSSNHLVIRRENWMEAYDLRTGSVVVSWQAPVMQGPLFSGAFSADGQWWVAAGLEGAGVLRNLVTGEERFLDFGVKQIRQLAFSPSGRYFAAASISGVGVLWERASGSRAVLLHGFLQGTSSVAFSPDGERLAIGGDGNEAVKLWDVESHQELLTLEGEGSIFNSVAFSPDGNILGASNRQGRLHLWRAPSFEEIERLDRGGERSHARF